MGAISIISAVYPPSRHRLELLAELLPVAAPQVASGAAAAAGLLLIAVSAGLSRRKRRAWQVATAASAGLVALHVVKGLDVEEAVLAGAALALLMITRPAFTGAPDPRSRRHVAFVGAVGFGAASTIGVCLILLARHRVVGTPSLGQVLLHVWAGMVGVEGPVRFVFPTTSARIATTLVLLGVAVAGLTLAAALRPAGGPRRLARSEADLVRGLLVGHGQQDSLAYFSLRDDKSVMFSPSGKAAVAYTVISGVSLASGDPLGDIEAWPSAIAAWLDEARSHAWLPAVLGASERGATAFHRAGLDAVEIGDEAVVEVAGFSLQGRNMRGLRQAVNRLHRKGFTVQVDRIGDLSSPQLVELTVLSDRWRADGVERGFSMALGRVGDPRDPDVLIARCLDDAGVPQSLLTFVPWGKNGLSLDVMRRAPQSENGVLELTVAAVLGQGSALGIDRVSLNFAVFRAVFDRGGRLGAGPVLRVCHRALLLAGRFWQIESLYRANIKYQPTWQPRFVCFARPRDLPRIGVAVLEAEAFVRRPRWFPRGGRATSQTSQETTAVRRVKPQPSGCAPSSGPRGGNPCR